VALPGGAVTRFLQVETTPASSNSIIRCSSDHWGALGNNTLIAGLTPESLVEEIHLGRQSVHSEWQMTHD
jgi:hypothetical protein